jgi:hypothetical protein
MKQLSLLTLLVFYTLPFFAQSTAYAVYEMLQEKCMQCHSGSSPQAGLDLQGSGSSAEERAQDVYQHLLQATPANPAAAAAGDAYIYPGRPDKSYLFKKINQGLEPTLSLSSEEGQAMPPEGHPPLSAVEKELIRQWILFGAPGQGEVVEESLLQEYYSGNALQSFPDGPPAPPAAGEGFQVKMGPFYLPPGGELEYFQKYELDLPADLEVTRLDMAIGTFSHHFILYDFNTGGDANIPHGLRLGADHSNIGLVAAVQEPTDLKLPEGTAFFWDDQLVLDLNAHYINYSATAVYQAEVYLNVYTQETGTAAQEMITELISNLGIFIPNDGDPVSFSQTINPDAGEIYLWGLMGHTHQYGTGYKAYERLGGGSENLIYDGACPNGVPGCISPFFDYQHIPMRYFEPLRPIMMSPERGIRHEASWLNNGPEPVGFGPTSEDEMMVMVVMFTTDTTGVVSTSAPEAWNRQSLGTVYPNPSSGLLHLECPGVSGPIDFQLLDVQGRAVYSQSLNATGGIASLQLPELPDGLYWYRLQDRTGRWAAGKLVLE